MSEGDTCPSEAKVKLYYRRVAVTCFVLPGVASFWRHKSIVESARVYTNGTAVERALYLYRYRQSEAGWWRGREEADKVKKPYRKQAACVCPFLPARHRRGRKEPGSPCPRPHRSRQRFPPRFLPVPAGPRGISSYGGPCETCVLWSV